MFNVSIVAGADKSDGVVCAQQSELCLCEKCTSEWITPSHHPYTDQEKFCAAVLLHVSKILPCGSSSGRFPLAQLVADYLADIYTKKTWLAMQSFCGIFYDVSQTSLKQRVTRGNIKKYVDVPLINNKTSFKTEDIATFNSFLHEKQKPVKKYTMISLDNKYKVAASYLGRHVVVIEPAVRLDHAKRINQLLFEPKQDTSCVIS